MRKGEQAREEMVKDVSGQILRNGIEVRRRWAQYFEVLNVADVWEANINVVGNWRMPVLEDLNERAILLEEVGGAVNEMRSGKAPGLDGFPVECLKKGGMAVLEWPVRLLNLSFDVVVVPMDMKLNEFNAAIFAWHCVLSDCPPMLWWLSHGEGRDAVT